MLNSLTFNGLKLHGAMTIVTPAFLAILAGVIQWPKMTLSDTLVNAMPVPVEKVPYFCVMYILTFWFLTVMTYMFGIVSTRKDGYDNRAPRKMAQDKSLGILYRVHCAHDNTTECLAWFTASLFVSEQLGLDPVLKAKWSILVIVSRTVYPFLYAFNIDALRTSFFAMGFFSAFIMGWTAVFAE